ncbi:MAG TPA: SDR family oxidoreductase [Acidimicrobiales bacterium]|jgi:short-subunit dehydrogenase|nr:SDR family oxidoreductase [Acidimicrobiales bacterium]
MPTALVTGASSGIGLAFARKLAATGHDLVIVARSKDKLDELADEVRVNVEVLPADLTDPAQVANVEARLTDASRPVDLLVNNAGSGTNGLFADTPIDVLDREVALDVIAPMRLTHAALPGMIARGSGGILNVASIAAFQAGPLNAVYSASKAFVLYLSEAVHEEARKSGVHVTVLCPGATRTEFQQRGGFTAGKMPDFLWDQPETVVAHALKALARNQAVCVPGVLNKISTTTSHLAPRRVARKISAVVSSRI